MKLSFAKRFTSAAVTTVFTVTTVMAVMPPPVHAAEEESYLYTDDGFAYIVNEEGTITIKGRDKSREDEYDKTKIVLPSKIDGKYVTEIDTNYFGHGTYSHNDVVTEIVLPDHIEKINNWAFNDYKTLDTLIIPKTLKEAVRPFTYCKINKIIIEDGMESIPNELFWCTDFIGEIVIPDSVTAIGERSIASCSGLKEIHVPDSVKSIGYCAFDNNPDLEVLDLPDTLDYIGTCAFAENPKLTSVTVPDTWTFGEDQYGFFQYSGITEISFGPDRKIIPPSICSCCRKLETINWPKAPEKIMNRAFEQCESITDPKIPDSVEFIDSYAFKGCTGITNLDLPKNLKELCSDSFNSLTSLKYLYVPMQLPAKGNYSGTTAFWNSGIEKLEYAEGITEVNAMTASGLPYLTEVVIPDSVTFINNYSFDGDKSLAHIDLHEGITKIGRQTVFGGCNSLKELRIPSTLVLEGYELSSAPALETVYVPDGWTEIPAGAFRNCEHLKKAVIPDSVTKINTLAFSRCYELETIDAPREEYELENGAFSYCNNLWDERFSIAKKGDLFITKSSPSNAAGDITNYTVYYSINPRFLDTFGKAHLDVSVKPWKHLVIDESLPDGLTAGDVGFKLDLGTPTGIFRFSVRNPEDATVNVNAEFSAKTYTPDSYEWDTKALTVTDTEFDPVSVNVPDRIAPSGDKLSFSVYGYAPIGEQVSILVNGEENTVVDSNKYTGKYSAQVECELSDSAITVQAVCGDKKSDKKTVSIDPSMPVLVDFDVTHYTHGTDHWTNDLTDMFETGYSPYVPINPGRPFEFDVEMGNDDNVYKVFVGSETAGKRSLIPLERDAETGRWKGSGNFDTTIPGDLTVNAIPKQKPDVLTAGKTSDGTPTLTNKEGKNLLDTSKQTDPDPVDKFIEKFPPKVVESSSKSTAVKFTCPGYFPYEGTAEPSINVFQGITDSTFIDGKEVEPNTIIDSPGAFGFTESATKVVDENGDVNTFYTRFVLDDQEGREFSGSAMSRMYLDPADKSKGTVSDFIGSNGSKNVEGVVIVQKNETTGETNIINEFFSATEDLLKDEIGGAYVSLIVDTCLQGTMQTAGGVISAVGAGVQNSIDMYGYYYQYSDRLEQIETSKDPDVRNNAAVLKTASTALFLGRACVAAGSVAGSIALVAGGVAFWPALAAGAAITFCAWGWGKIFDWMEGKLDGYIYRSRKGNLKVGIDPSGYVYAAVPDNRIEGATATIYYKDESGKAVLWNAVDYDQINPMITDSQGGFMWDVPEGLWQVKITAEGYEDYTAEWLPVLPVQTDVNIPMKTRSAASLGSIDACSNAVEVTMTQYITDSTATSENIYLTGSDGKKLSCKIKPVKSETNDTEFSDRLLLISDKENIAGSTLHITSGLLNYSGIPTSETVQKITEVKSEYLVDNDASLGDVNEDGKVDAKDASLILVYYSKMSTGGDGGFTEAQISAANVNDDTLIDAKDASFILAYYAMASTASGEVPTMSEYMSAKAS
ncbi:MAG: leucine-rich repeat protein [Ruminococcus sp.]|nr:leucine-rich repeat protein [Ruminococcus sp.]